MIRGRENQLPIVMSDLGCFFYGADILLYSECLCFRTLIQTWFGLLLTKLALHWHIIPFYG